MDEEFRFHLDMETERLVREAGSRWASRSRPAPCSAWCNLHLNPLSQSSSDFNVDGFEPPADHGAFIADRVVVDPGSSGRRASRSSASATSTTPTGRTRGPWSSSARRWPGASGRRAPRSAGSSGGATALRFVLSAFGALALTLAAVGLYGVVSYGVARRTREIGIRKALGADGPRVVRLLVAGGLRLVLVGGALGLALALVATRLLGGLLFEVDAFDRLTFAGVPLVLGAAPFSPPGCRPAAPAGSVPSWRSGPTECRPRTNDSA